MQRLLSVGAIAVTLAFCAYAKAQEQPHGTALLPDLYKCFDLLRLESLQIDQQERVTIHDPNQVTLLNEYFGVAGWLRGFFTGINGFGFTPDRDVTKDTKEKEWLPWIYSYCRSHPNDNLAKAALQLANALSGSSNKGRK